MLQGEYPRLDRSEGALLAEFIGAGDHFRNQQHVPRRARNHDQFAVRSGLQRKARILDPQFLHHPENLAGLHVFKIDKRRAHLADGINVDRRAVVVPCEIVHGRNAIEEIIRPDTDDEGNVGTDMESIIRICPMPSKEETQCLIKDAWYMGQSTRSPLVLDIDGDGVETIGTNNGIYFDHDNNGFAENTGWAGADDGLLVRDTNNNGSIDNGTELFGNNTILSSGQNAQNGFDALADLDSNKDGVFNSSDTAWNEVKVWKDSNSDATVNEGELITLENANINAINLSYNEQDVTS